MARPRSRVVDFTIYLLVRFFICLVQAFSLEAGRKLAAGLAWLAYRINRRHGNVARDNLKQAFPGRFSEAELNEMVRGVYRHFCTMLIEIIHLPRRLHVSNWRRHLDLEPGKKVIREIMSGRPVLIVTGHFGNWELAGFALGLLGFTTHAIARELDNPYLDRLLKDFREKTGQKVLSKHGDFDRMQAVLQTGGVIATLADQDAGRRGLFVPFFGRPASTHKAIALLALEHRAPLVVVGTPRVTQSMGYQVVVGDVIYPEEYEGRPDAIRAMTERFTRALENIIREYPGQYFWLHRRWKHQPHSRKKQAA